MPPPHKFERSLDLRAHFDLFLARARRARAAKVRILIRSAFVNVPDLSRDMICDIFDLRAIIYVDVDDSLRQPLSSRCPAEEKSRRDFRGFHVADRTVQRSSRFREARHALDESS
jgi:hypothetical protein